MSVSSIGTIIPSFFGRGPSTPFRLDRTGARPVIAKDEEIILESIATILSTDVSERPFVVRDGIPFGTNCRKALFAPVDVAIDIIRYECKRALIVWEPRIVVDEVTATEGELEGGHRAVIATTFFRYRSTNRADNFVLPFRTRRAP